MLLGLVRWLDREDIQFAKGIRDSMGPQLTPRQAFWRWKVLPVLTTVVGIVLWPMALAPLLWHTPYRLQMWHRRWYWGLHRFAPKATDLVRQVSEAEAAANFYFLSPDDQHYARRLAGMPSSWAQFLARKPVGAQLWWFEADRKCVPSSPPNDRVIRTGYVWVLGEDMSVWSIHLATPYASGRRPWWRKRHT